MKVYGIFGNLQFDSIVIACNTAHILLPQIKDLLSIEPNSLILATQKHISSKNLNEVGLLASPTTIRAQLFGSSSNFLTLDEEGIKQTEQVIRAVIAGKQSKVAKELKSLIFQLKQQGATHIILGCTELSVAMDEDGDESLIDPLSLVVDEIIMKQSRV